jgi:cob(I)alamin adenosyltransferase
MGRSRIYTRGGDAGFTRLLGGQEISKDHPRVSAYGTLDELSAVLGLGLASLGEAPLPAHARDSIAALLREIQGDLLMLGAFLATLPEERAGASSSPRLEEPRQMEALIDAFEAPLPPLTAFILSGSNTPEAHLHVARTVCRRAERHVVTLHREGLEGDPRPLVYLNRLSDLLFVLARHLRGDAPPSEDSSGRVNA